MTAWGRWDEDVTREKLVLETIRMSAGANCIMRRGSHLLSLMRLSLSWCQRAPSVSITWGHGGNTLVLSIMVNILTDISHRDWRPFHGRYIYFIDAFQNWNIFSILKIEMSSGIFFVLRQYYYFVNIGNTNIADENNNFLNKYLPRLKKFYWYFSRHQRSK